MKKINNKMELRVNRVLEIVDNQIESMFEKTVTKFGSGAKIDCPKEYLGKEVYVIVRKSK
jgi:putative transposon-encoded protein